MQIPTRLLARRDRPTVPPASPVRRASRARCTRRAAQAARDELMPLLEAAANLDLDNPEAVAEFRRLSHGSTARLAAAGHLPPSLIVATDDPGVVIARILAAAWHRAAGEDVGDHAECA